MCHTCITNKEGNKMNKTQEIAFVTARLHFQARNGLWDMVAKSLETLKLIEERAEA